MALRRWKPFLGAFTLIDAAIEAADADGPLSRDEFRSARARIVELLCDAAGDDDGGVKAEAICVLLDEAMAESLATLRAVPVENMARRVLASGELVGAVGALMREHASERVRELAGDVVRGWKAGARAEFDRARATMDVLDGLSSTPPPPPRHDTAPAVKSDTKPKREEMKIQQEQPRPRKAPIVSSRRVSSAVSYGASSAPIVSTSNAKKPSANMEAQAPVPAQPKKEEMKILEEQPRSKTPTVASSRVKTAESKGSSSTPIVSSSNGKKPSANMEAPKVVPAQPKKTQPVVVSSVAEEQEKMATKRKLHERYQEAEDAKRRRTIQVIKPPRRPPPGTTSQRQHQAMRARGLASCAAERVFMKSCSLQFMI